MTRKDEIVDRLLKDGHISSKEAILLLKETEVIQQFQSPPFGTPNNGKIPYHEICGCNVCHCTMANKMVDYDNSGHYNPKTTQTISSDTKHVVAPNGLYN